MKNQLKSKTTQNGDLDYSYLSMEEPLDSTNVLKQEVMKSAFKKWKGQSSSVRSNQRDKFVDEESNKIIKLVKDYPEDNLGYDDVCQDLVKMKQYNQVKIPIFQMEISGSSSEELDPIYQPADDVIVIAAGAPITCELYIIGKIVTPDNIRVQPTINIVQQFKGAQLPQIELAQLYNTYKIYKITVSSLVRKYQVVAESNKIRLNSDTVLFDDRNAEPLLFEKGFFFNFGAGNVSKIGLLEQIFIYSIFQKTQVEGLKNKIDRITLKDKEAMTISDELFEIIPSADSIQYFCELTLSLTSEWRIGEKLSNEQIKIYRLLALSFLYEKSLPFLEQTQKGLRFRLIFQLIDIIIQSSKRSIILTKPQSTKLLQKVLNDIANRYEDNSAFLVLEKLNLTSCKLLKQKFTQDEFLTKFLLPFCVGFEDQLAAKILTTCYYYKMQIETSPLEATLTIINGIAPEFEKFDTGKSKYLVMSIESLFGILSNQYSMKISQLKPQSFLQLLRLFPLLQRLEKNSSQKMAKEIVEQTKDWIQKKPKSLLKQKKYTLVIQILNQILLNETISACFYKQGAADTQLGKILEQILYSKIDDEATLRKINKLLVLESIIKGKEISGIYDKYSKFLTNLPRKSALRILNEGLSSEFFKKERNQNQFQKILAPVISHFYRDLKIIQQDWSLSFMFYSYINEKILEAVISLKKSKSSNLDFEEFLDEIRAIVRSLNIGEQQRERLQIIVEQEKQLDKESIKKYLKNKEKFYVKVLLDIVSKSKDQRKQKVNLVLAEIRSQINQEQYTYRELIQIMPHLEKDQERLSKLFGPETFNKMKGQIVNISQKVKRIQKIQDFLDIIKQKFTVPAAEIEKQKKQLRQAIKDLQQASIFRAKSVPSFSYYEQSLLSLCRYSFLFKNAENNYQSLKPLFDELKQKMNETRRSMQSLLKGLRNQELLLDEYFFFEIEELSQQQIKQILKYLSPDNVNASKMLKLAISYNQKLQFYVEISRAFDCFLEADAEFNGHIESNNELIDLYTRIKQRRQGSKISMRQYEKKFQILEKFLKKLQIKFSVPEIQQVCSNLPLENLFKNIDQYKYLQQGPISIVLSLIILTKKSEAFTKLNSLGSHMQSIKQMFNNSNHSNIQLRYQDFQIYNVIMKFYNNQFLGNRQQGLSLRRIIGSIKQSSDRININVEESFNKKLISLANNANQFEDCYNNLKNPNHSQRVSIQKLVANSRIHIKLDAQRNTHQLTVQVKVSEENYQEEKLFQLEKYKDEAYIIKNKSADMEEDQKQRHDIKVKIDTFLRMYGFVHNINEMLGELLRSGFMLFENKEEMIRIINGDLEEMTNYLNKISEVYKEWDQNMKIICSYSSKATMLGGPKIKQFYQLLITQKPSAQDFEKFRFIANPTTIQSFKQRKTPINEDIPAPFSHLDLIKQFFKFLKTEHDKVVPPAKDREEHYVELFRFEEQENDYICCLNQISKQKLKGVGEGQILSCKKDSTKQDVESFIDRSILDSDNQYILLGYDNMDQKLQNLVIHKIENCMLNNNNRIKLCVTGRETSHAIYRFLNNKTNVTKKIQGKGMQEQTKEYIQFFNTRLNNQKQYGLVRIYKSTYPGLGKTHEITKQIAKNKHKVIYFPISGKTNSINLFNRLQNKVKLMDDNGYSILFQIYEIEKESKDIVNDFVRQLIMNRSFEYRKEFCVVDRKCRIYLEIQDENVTTNLPFLRLLSRKFPEIVEEIKALKFEKIEYTPTNYKLSYILDHLQAFDKNQLDARDLPHPKQHKPNIKADLSLIKKYFIDKFPKDLLLTFYQFKYWVDLFYESCGSFSGNYLISQHFFKDNYPAKMITELGLQNIRSQFFKTLLDNSIEFLSFSVQNLLDPTKSRKGNKNIEFFIVPNNEYGWFSFIYKSTENVPKSIRSYFVSQASLQASNKGKKPEELQKQIFDKKQLKKLETTNREEFENNVEEILRSISGVNSYSVKKDANYVLNMDNFVKICLISYKMKVNIPLVIQGQAGVGKTALLRHLVEQVFDYQFIPHTINAGLTEELLLKKIEEAEEKLKEIEVLNANKHIKKKVCILFDEFNTLPELGYIKQLMMENRFMGEQMSFFKDLIVFAACNPYRALKKSKDQNKSMMMREEGMRQAKKQEKQAQLAFTVKRPPLAMGQIMWNFGSLSEADMDKYVSRMISVVDRDLPEYKLINLVCQIQNKLNTLQFGSASLRDVQRFRQLYSWLKDKIPIISKRKINSEQISNLYEKRSLRAFAVSLNLTYFTRLNSKIKYEQITKLVDVLSTNLTFRTIHQIVKFEQEDFSQRLNINYEGVYLNAALKQNLYCVFVCFMTRLPILIVGSPGCSKSLASRIISDNFKQENQDGKNVDQWIKQLPKISEFFFQGSENCTTSSVERKFYEINLAEESFKKRNEKAKLSNKIIPVFVFDEMGLAQKSPDNPLKAIHEPLELSVNSNKKGKSCRQIAFLGISNNDLDLSKMSRFLVLRRADLQIEDLKATAKGISKSIFSHTNFNHTNLEPYLESLSATYFNFIIQWRAQAAISQIHKNFFGLRDFYNLIRTTADLIKNKESRNNLQNISQVCDLAIFRNFNGLADSYNIFRNMFFRELGREVPKIEHKLLNQVLQSLGNKGRRYPLLIVPDSISQSIFLTKVNNKFKNSCFIFGSPFSSDCNKSEYITKNITQVMKIVESDKIMVASSLNKTAQGALFDLFNKFFIKRDGNDFYRIALQESGYSTTAAVNPNFNAAIMINAENLFKESAPFLNRFEKYEFNLDYVKDQKLNDLSAKLNQCFGKIEQICKAEGLEHYKRDYLFVNLSLNTLRSLIYRQLTNAKENESQAQIYNKCIHTLSKVATKDFEFILQLIISKSETQFRELKVFKQGLEKKIKLQKQAQVAIIISTSENIWKTNKNDDKILSLEICKSEENLVHEIKTFYKTMKDKEATLFIDFTKQSDVYGTNMNGSKAYFKQKEGQSRIQINYILYLLKRCKQQLENEKMVSTKKKVRLILNYNRLEAQRFTGISFLESCDLFSLDGSSGTQSKKAFKDVNLNQILKESLKSFRFSLEGVEDNDDLKKDFEKMKIEIYRNQIFADACKDALAEVLGGQTEINSEDKINALKNPENLKKFSSIVTALTHQFSKTKFLLPMKIFMKMLLNQGAIMSFSFNSKNAILSQFNHQDGLLEQMGEAKEQIKPFLKEMTAQKIAELKKNYRQLKQKEQQSEDENNIFEAKFNLPTYFPYSQIETNILFSPEIEEKIKGKVDFNYPQFEQEYNKKLQDAFIKSDTFNHYKKLTRSTNEEWKKLLLADALIVLAEKAKISSKYVLHFVNQIESLLKSKETFLMKMVTILSNLDFWCSALKIFHSFAQNQIYKKMKPLRSTQVRDMSFSLLQYCQSQLALGLGSVQSLKVAGNLNQRLKKFAEIHHNVFFEIQNMANSQILEIVTEEYKQMVVTEQFLSIWETINLQAPQIDYTDLLKRLESTKILFDKIQIIKNFLITVIEQKQELSKDIYEYLANKLFPGWFNQCGKQAQIEFVFEKFYELCQSSMTFAHNSTGSIYLAFSSLKIQFDRIKIRQIIQKIQNQEYTSIRQKLLYKMGQKCQAKKFEDNLSILFTNILEINIKRFNLLTGDPQKNFTLADLQQNLDNFRILLQEILQGRSPILKLFAFAFFKQYLLHFVTIGRPENDTCIQIDQMLCQESALTQNLRFYCLKILRKTLNAKQISEQYVKLGTFRWCTMFRTEMREEQSRAIEVPKVLDEMQKPDIMAKIQLFTKYEGRDFNYLDEVIDLGSKTPDGRYIVLNFFMKYLYSMAYNKQYKAAIVNHIKTKQAEYSTKMGKQQYKLLLRYATSSFDHLHSVQKHETFSQQQFITLNNINWLFATKSVQSPLHSLFFKNGVIHQSIEKEISASFLPCGVENYFNFIASMAYTDTKNCNVGVYICSNHCDYLYTHLNCGWPSQSRPCEMCGQTIGSSGGHRIARTNQGGRRLMSEKLIDNSNFYMGSIKAKLGQQYWDAQRCYIQAEINRMRTKKQMVYKPELNGARNEERINLLGYDMNKENDRFGANRGMSMTANSVLLLCLQANLYGMVSLDVIKPEQYVKLFRVDTKEKVLEKINGNLKRYVESLKQVVDLNTKFYTWIFGIQAEIYKFLINFSKQFDAHVKSIQAQSQRIVKKLKQKQPTLNNDQYRALYSDLIRVIESGITLKQYRDIQTRKEMSAHNQFTRQLFEQHVQKIVTNNLFEHKLAFIQTRFEALGKMQFPYDIYITENKYDPRLYCYARILKVPSQFLTIDQIVNKYEIIIRDKYPFLNYLLKHVGQLSMLQSFFEIARGCNQFWQKMNYEMTRGYAKKFKLNEFNKEMCKNNINLPIFLKQWKRVTNHLGPIQVGCKVYGNANSDFTDDTPVYNFLLDNIIKDNANGKIIAGIFHNYAILHNQVLGSLNTSKNLIQKYRNMNLFGQNCKINPQKIQQTDCISISSKELTNKIIQSSVSSIKYGDNLVYHNFDVCEAYFLTKLKGRCQLISDVQKYATCKYVCQTFNQVTPGTNVNAYGDIRQKIYEPLSQDLKSRIKSQLKQKSQLQVYKTVGLLQQLVNKISQNTQNIEACADMQIKQYIQKKIQNLNLDDLLADDLIEGIFVPQIVPLMEFVELFLRSWLKRAIPEKYRVPLEPDMIIAIKDMLTRISEDTSGMCPTIAQLRTATENYVYRNLLSEYCAEERKIFEFILSKDDLWPNGYDIYTTNANLFSDPVLNSIEAKNAVKFMEMVEAFI